MTEPSMNGHGESAPQQPDPETTTVEGEPLLAPLGYNPFEKPPVNKLQPQLVYSGGVPVIRLVVMTDSGCLVPWLTVEEARKEAGKILTMCDKAENTLHRPGGSGLILPPGAGG